jgi:hypothetical protein
MYKVIMTVMAHETRALVQRGLCCEHDFMVRMANLGRLSEMRATQFVFWLDEMKNA